MKIEYYLYFSDTKLEMLYPQLSRFEKFKLKFRLGTRDISMTLDLENEKHKVRKMKQLSKYILRRGDIGTIDNPIFNPVFPYHLFKSLISWMSRKKYISSCSTMLTTII